MYGGHELYELATQLTRERQDEAHRLRMASRARKAARARRADSLRPQQSEEHGPWTLEWVHSGFAGVRVTVRDESTGQERSGRHAFDWDIALGQALCDSGLKV